MKPLLYHFNMVWKVWLYITVMCLLSRVQGQGGDDGNKEYPASRRTAPTASPENIQFSSVEARSTIIVFYMTSASSITISTSITEPTMEPSFDIIPIIGGGVGGGIVILILVVIILLIVLAKRKNKSSNREVEETDQQLKLNSLHTEEIEEPKYKEIKSIPETPPTGIAPVIEMFPSTMTVWQGYRVTFDVKVSGKPIPTYAWYHEGNAVESDYAHEIHEDGSLVIFSAEIQHQGTYRFVAINSSGSVDQQVILNVVKPRNITTCDEKRGPIPLIKFGEFVAENHAESNNGFHSQFSMLGSGENEHPVTVAAIATNKPLNRFANITVYDDNRIILKPLTGKPDCQNTYINASYVEGYSTKYNYIATQGPLKKTTVDFWRLIWQEKPHIIVMVTNLIEDRKIKCQQYWPESGSVQSYGPFKVTLADEQVYTDYIIRTLQLELQGSSEHPQTIIQYHFTSWPDHGVPEHATSILSFYQRVKAEYQPKKGPMLVHCSAGVGRTGIFITIDLVLKQIQNEGIIDIPKIINGLRQQRMKMVQTADQYVFINHAILEAIICGNTQINVIDFRQRIRKMNSTDSDTGLNEFQRQFQILEQVTPKPDQVRRDIAIQFTEKNRSMDYAPSDEHRVALIGEIPDYISAVFITGYKPKSSFIVAEGPMQSTCRAFWKMIIDRECHAIVMLGHLNEEGRNVCYQYWPSITQPEIIGEFLVTLENETPFSRYIVRMLVVHNSKTKEKQTVTQYQIIDWNYNGHAESSLTIIAILGEIHKVQQMLGGSSILVHCSDTVTRSGIFCALFTVIEKCKSENIVDVFQVVKTQRINKPGSVPTTQHYQFIFELVLTYLDTLEV